MKKEIQPLSADQTRALLRTAHGDLLEALYLVAITASLREGELLGLSWEDLDLDTSNPTGHWPMFSRSSGLAELLLDLIGHDGR